MNSIKVDGTPFVSIPIWVLQNLSLPALRTYLTLMVFAEDRWSEGAAFPDPLSLSSMLRMSRDTVQAQINELIEVGALKVEDGPEGSQAFTLAWREPFQGEKVEALKSVPSEPTAMEQQPQKDSGKRDLQVNDIMESHLEKLYNVDPKWQTLAIDPGFNQAGYAALRKLINEYGQGIVTMALGHAWESRLHVTAPTAYPLLRTVCEKLRVE